MKRTVCYASFPDKRRLYVEKTLPLILATADRHSSDRAFHAWLNGVLSPFTGHAMPHLEMLRALHDAARSGIYLEELGADGELSNCDHVRELGVTVTQGGDCEDWAAVLLAACKRLGVSAYIVTSGESHDPFLHVALAALMGGRLYLLDPKGDSIGASFNVRSESYPVRQYWTQGLDGRANEVHIAAGVAA